MTLAPIVLFVYNRPWHTQQTIDALQKNEFANTSELFIYSDAPKNENAVEKVAEVRNYLKTVTGFKKVTIIERENNWGLAASIIDGVTQIINQYGKIIVLEDDLVTSPYFLTFMNEALDVYKNEQKVWHISGWSYPISANELDDTFLWRTMNCWGWATWADRWKHYEKNTNKLIQEFTPEMINNFNLDGAEDFWNQVIQNHQSKINTWAIYWYATIFENNGLCLNPTIGYVSNIGHDGSGVHCGESGYCDDTVLNITRNLNFCTSIEESAIALKLVQAFYRSQKKSISVRAINKLFRILIGKNLIP